MEGVNVVNFMFFFDHLSVLCTYNNVSINRLYGFSEFLRPSLNVLQFPPHLDSLQNDWMLYFPFNWASLIILFVGRCLIYCTCFRVFPCQTLSVQCSAVQCSAARNPNLEVAIVHARQVYSQHHSRAQCFPPWSSCAEELWG